LRQKALESLTFKKVEPADEELIKVHLEAVKALD